MYEIVILRGEVANDSWADGSAGEISKAAVINGSASYWTRRAVWLEKSEKDGAGVFVHVGVVEIITVPVRYGKMSTSVRRFLRAGRLAGSKQVDWRASCPCRRPFLSCHFVHVEGLFYPFLAISGFDPFEDASDSLAPGKLCALCGVAGRVGRLRMQLFESR